MNEMPGSRTVQVLDDATVLTGDLTVPAPVRAVVVFAHGSGSSRLSPRNRFVARTLQDRGRATFLLDLLTPEEEALDRRTGHLRFEIGLLAHRLQRAIEWVGTDPATSSLPVGLFGASTGAAAALVAAARKPDVVRSVVSRGGRPDLADEYLPRVIAPTLLIVGSRDEVVVELNRQAYRHLGGERKLEIVPGATHLFEEPGALDEVARLAADWFTSHLVGTDASVRRRG